MKNEDSIACMEAFLRKADLSSVKDLKEVAFLSLSIPDLATAAEAVGRIAVLTQISEWRGSGIDTALSLSEDDIAGILGMTYGADLYAYLGSQIFRYAFEDARPEEDAEYEESHILSNEEASAHEAEIDSAMEGLSPHRKRATRLVMGQEEEMDNEEGLFAIRPEYAKVAREILSGHEGKLDVLASSSAFWTPSMLFRVLRREEEAVNLNALLDLIEADKRVCMALSSLDEKAPSNGPRVNDFIQDTVSGVSGWCLEVHGDGRYAFLLEDGTKLSIIQATPEVCRAAGVPARSWIRSEPGSAGQVDTVDLGFNLVNVADVPGGRIVWCLSRRQEA